MSLPTARQAPARLIIVGPQGSGKGTQGKILAERLGVPAISTGDLFRRHVTDDSALGRQVNAAIHSGLLVSDGLTATMVRQRLEEPDARQGFLLDGFPRTADQATLLDDILGAQGGSLDTILVLDVPRHESIERLRRRAADQGRADDTAEVIARRLDIYDREIGPLLAHYGEMITTIDGSGTVEEIAARVAQALDLR